MVGIRDLANHIIKVASDEKTDITNLQLQKIMFFIFGKNLDDVHKGKVTTKIVYDLPFSRWTYGPVVEDIYYSYNVFGPNPIQDVHATDNKKLDTYNEYILKFLKVDPFELVEITHRLPSWNDYRDDILARRYVPPYKEEEIAKEFVQKDD
ncbi:type II toxin-antitoxin system antitoxin SocA domain-containing protein [Sporosarcina sp. USHLN248]|uniref:type II toxin-antitoxin system antitoxin SocA domain-containing protein n=1 Tax=Sporosarcina sp. USHLN248 TaxID=3081300 RepID=UPI0030159202